MKLLSVSPPDSGGRERARVDIEVCDGVRLHNVKVTPWGGVFARNATLSQDVIKQISELYLSEKGDSHDARRR